MRELVRRSPRYFLSLLVLGLLLRLLFFFFYPHVTDDSRLYGDIARNWLNYGVYGITDSGRVVPTYARLPGYPAFLAAIFWIFGPDDYRAVLLLQVLVDLGTCFIVADSTRRLLGSRPAKAAFLLTALCPFLANYSAAALTETLEIFFTALALDFAITGLGKLEQGEVRSWVGCGFACAADILLRPDGGILVAAIGAYLLFILIAPARSQRRRKHVLWAGCLLAICSFGPLLPWTVRNFRTLHRFEPLTPRYANGPEDFVAAGFNRWVKTWMADYVSVEEIYWNEPGEKIDPTKLPSRAFDSLQQKETTFQLLDSYNQDADMSPKLDAEFAQLAQERIQASPFRYYLWLPGVRIADMWLRPRTELLPPDPRWWEFNDDLRWIVLALGLALVNVLYLGLGLGGVLCARPIPWLGVFLWFIIVRSLFLGSLENPEPRYTLECYPVAILLASAVFCRWPTTQQTAPA